MPNKCLEQSFSDTSHRAIYQGHALPIFFLKSEGLSKSLSSCQIENLKGVLKNSSTFQLGTD